MARNLTTGFANALTAPAIKPAFLVVLTFKSSTQYVWTGRGSITWGGMTFTGIGTAGTIGTVNEGVSIQAQGTTLSLSGIDLTILNECLSDIRLGAPATIYFALLDSSNNIIADPYVLYKGTVDRPQIRPGTDTATITLALENKLINLQRARQRRYTSADQRQYHPNDTGFVYVESLNDIALRWGVS